MITSKLPPYFGGLGYYANKSINEPNLLLYCDSDTGTGSITHWVCTGFENIYRWTPQNSNNYLLPTSETINGNQVLNVIRFNGTYPYVNQGDASFLRLKKWNSSTSTYDFVSQRDLFGYQKSFTIQMTCTFEPTSGTSYQNYRGMMGIGHPSTPAINGTTVPTGSTRDAIIMGQYQNGNVVWGFFPYLGSASQKVISVPINVIQNLSSGRFCWTFIYDNENKIAKLYLSKDNLGSLYYNSMSVTTPPQMCDINPNTSVSVGVGLGMAYWSTDRHMKGNIYSVLMYSRALRTEELIHNFEIQKRLYLL